jgi:hypothetical protein
VYTANMVSKSEPAVVTVIVDGDDVVKSYQAVLPISVPEQVAGSLDSVPAKIVLLLSLKGSGCDTEMALAKLSFAGGVPAVMVILSCPGGISTLPTWMR